MAGVAMVELGFSGDKISRSREDPSRISDGMARRRAELNMIGDGIMRRRTSWEW